MKVLKNRGPMKGWSQDFICTGAGNGNGGCRARLCVEFKDLYHTYRTDYIGDREVYTTFRCPVCDSQTDIDYNGSNYDSIPDAYGNPHVSYPNDSRG